MEKNERICLNRGQTISLSTRKDGKMPENYSIRSIIGEGGSSVCYEAVRERDGQSGKLKEFYPVNGCTLERMGNGQLTANEESVCGFGDLCQEYIDTYYLLKKITADNQDNQVLKNYFQGGDVLYGTLDMPGNEPGGSGQKATVYIWSTGIEGQRFDEYLSEIREHPERNADGSLHDILQTAITLTDGIRALHTAGLIHLDIKPSNFLVSYDSYHKINANNVSLFDIDTLYSIYNGAPKRAGTNGYRAPEVPKGRADNRSDIYSIGAMLFHAIVVSEHVPDGLYKDSCYDGIDQLVKHSKLIEESRASLDVHLMAKLADILKRCLAYNPKNRYGSCSELLDDLKRAERFSVQYTDIQKLIGQNKRYAIVDDNEKGENEPEIVIQKLLYDHPLYEACEGEVEKLNVLVAGSGSFGQKFIDICLQSGQMKGCQLCITAVSNEPGDDMEKYLRFRPAIKRFVDVNGSMGQDKGRAYGELNFLSLESAACRNGEHSLAFSLDDIDGTKKIISDMISNAKEQGRPYDYVFIALGYDQLNHCIASIFSDSMQKLGNKTCPVCYICEKENGKEDAKEQDAMLHPVFIHEPITPETIDSKLEKMAFYTHMSWNDSINMDINTSLKKFQKSGYDHSSSLAYALSIKYKLRSIGIQTDDISAAAEQFADEILAKKETDPCAAKKFRELVALEHRRWVLFMAADGYDAPMDENGNLDLESCITNGCVKNEADHTHPCMVFSSEPAPLHNPEYSANGRKKWDDPDIDPELDELDRMSIDLHQCFKNAAERFKQENPLRGKDLSSLWDLVVNSNEQTIKAYRQFEFCLKNILNGMESYTKQYGYYADTLLDSIGKFSPEIKAEAEERLDLIKKSFFPVIEANMYRDYKAYDEKLVDKIPFILTYRFQPCIAMAFEDGKYQNGRNEAVFANVAAATVLSPEKVCYLYHYNKDSRLELLSHKISAVLNYLGKRNVHCKVLFAVVCPSGTSIKEQDELKKEFERIKTESHSKQQNATLEEYELIEYKDSTDRDEQIFQYLSGQSVDLYDGSTALFASSIDNGMFLSQVVERNIPYFEFDWKRKEFTKHMECDYLKFIQDGSCIRIHDMFALINADTSGFHYPEFMDDYEDLWDIYTGNYLLYNKYEYGVSNWNRLCIALEQYENSQPPLASIPLAKSADRIIKKMSFLLPEYAFQTAKYMLNKLTKYGAIEEESSISSYTSENCRAELIADESLEETFKSLFSKPQLFLRYYGMDVSRSADYNGEYAQITCNSLTVSDANLDPEGKGKYNLSYKVLEKLQDSGFISKLEKNQSDPRLASFEYSAPRIKKLLTNAGEILEIYTYYKVLETGYFDDVACGYEFQWEDGNVKNELDLILTKGFRSIIVECKAVQRLKQDYYHKLHSIAEHFGIGTIKALIGNTYKKNLYDDPNDMQRSRGAQLHIKTIDGQSQIQDIGNTLVGLMEEQA